MANRNARVARELLKPIAGQFGIPTDRPDVWLHLAMLLAFATGLLDGKGAGQ